MKKTRYIIIHEHKHGDSHYYFETTLPIENLPSIEELIDLLEIDFEPDKDEFIGVERMDDFADLDALLAADRSRN